MKYWFLAVALVLVSMLASSAEASDCCKKTCRKVLVREVRLVLVDTQTCEKEVVCSKQRPVGLLGRAKLALANRCECAKDCK
jgi:hypothetical protein